MVQSLKEMKEKEIATESIKNEMIASISHNLRTPVTSLIGYIELLKSSLHEDVQESAKYVNICERKCQELNKQIHNLLEYTQLNYREPTLNKETIGVKELLHQILIDFIPQLEEAGMNFCIQAPPSPVHVQADTTLLVRMLQM